MDEKIEWYKEVLALEPNSKLFFPLAVLLSQNGRVEEALDTLAAGLERHDEYLEARLFYIELLYTNGRSDKLEPELRKLQEMFAHYAGFWQAWAAFIAHDGSMDTASIMRFLAIYFTHRDLSLHTIIDKGLDALLREEGEMRTGGVDHRTAVSAGAGIAPPSVTPADEAYAPVSEAEPLDLSAKDADEGVTLSFEQKEGPAPEDVLTSAETDALLAEEAESDFPADSISFSAEAGVSVSGPEDVLTSAETSVLLAEGGEEAEHCPVPELTPPSEPENVLTFAETDVLLSTEQAEPELPPVSEEPTPVEPENVLTSAETSALLEGTGTEVVAAEVDPEPTGVAKPLNLENIVTEAETEVLLEQLPEADGASAGDASGLADLSAEPQEVSPELDLEDMTSQAEVSEENASAEPLVASTDTDLVLEDVADQSDVPDEPKGACVDSDLGLEDVTSQAEVSEESVPDLLETSGLPEKGTVAADGVSEVPVSADAVESDLYAQSQLASEEIVQVEHEISLGEGPVSADETVPEVTAEAATQEQAPSDILSNDGTEALMTESVSVPEELQEMGDIPPVISAAVSEEQGIAGQELETAAPKLDSRLLDLASDGESPVYADAELAAAEVVHLDTVTEPAAQAEVAQSESFETSEAEPKEEGISLRTRSMAEVLAEQGDIKGALDIYYELEGAATSAEETADLRQRIVTLRGLLTPQHAQEPEAAMKSDKTRVINLLEALSERLEARAQN